MSGTASTLDRIRTVGTRFVNGFTIEASVGDWTRGAKNNPKDVETVQLLLEHASKSTGRMEFNPQGVDKKIAQDSARSGTVKAIRAFQRGFMRNPDGIVDPDGRTIEKLRKYALGAKPGTAAAARSVMQAPQASAGTPPWLYTLNGSVFSKFLSHIPTPTVQPIWISVAEEELGEEEIAGKEHNPRVIEYHASTKTKAETDESPWCSSFVNWVMVKAGYEGTNSPWSHSWKNWGDGISKPAVGSIAFIDWGKVSEKKKGKGHVGIVVAKTASGRIVLLGGNQSGQVKYSAFRASHIAGYRVPKSYQVAPKLYDLPVKNVSGKGSSFESTR